MNNWKVQKVGIIADLNKETFNKKSLPHIIKYLDTGSLTKNKIENLQILNTKLDKIPSRAQRKIFKNTILYSTIRPNQEHYGIFENYFSDIVVSTGFATIDVKDRNIYAKFLYYLLIQKNITKFLHTIGMNAVSSYPAISPEDIGNLKFKFPDLPIQKQITKVLSDLDAKIELNNKINRELEAMAKLLYDYWFVQFDFPNEQGKPYKSSGGEMVYNSELKREIPKGWKVGCIGDYCLSTGGFAFKSSWWSDDGVSVVKIKDIQEDYTIDISNLSKVDLSNKKIDDKFKAKSGDILIAMTGATIGKYGIVPITKYPIYVNQRVGYFNLGIEPTEKLPYLINSLNQPYFREMINLIAGGAAQPNISNEQINKIPLLIANKTTTDIFNKKFSSYYKMILNNQEQNQQLSELRDWLLPMLMNGQVTVNNGVEEELSMAAESKVDYN